MPTDIIVWIAAGIFVIALIALAAWLYRSLAGAGSGGSFFGGRDRRLGVSEAVSMDGRRKLVLVRRDEVEHLIMTGGPIDIVVETGIQPRRGADAAFRPEAQSDRIALARDEQRAVRDPEMKR